MSVDPHYRASIKYHTVVDESSPFLLYGVEVQSPFSKTIVTKRYNHFSLMNALLVSNYREVRVVGRNKGRGKVPLREAVPRLLSSIEGSLFKRTPNRE